MKKLFGFVAILLFVCCTAFAANADLATTDQSGIPGLSVKQALWISIGSQAFKWLSELYGSIRNGGGLKRIITSFWLGEQTPKVIADDYKAELSKPPFAPKPVEPQKP